MAPSFKARREERRAPQDNGGVWEQNLVLAVVSHDISSGRGHLFIGERFAAELIMNFRPFIQFVCRNRICYRTAAPAHAGSCGSSDAA